MIKERLSRETLLAFGTWHRPWVIADRVRSAIAGAEWAESHYEPEVDVMVKISFITVTGESIDMDYRADEIVFLEHLLPRVTRKLFGRPCDEDGGTGSESEGSSSSTFDPEHVCFTLQEAGSGTRPACILPYQTIDATAVEIPHHHQTAWENSSASFTQRDMEGRYSIRRMG